MENELQVISIEEHPTHGTFDVEVPIGMEEGAIKKYVSGLDLDLLLGVQQEDDKDLGVTNVEKLKEWENSVGAGKRNGKWFSHASLEGGTDTIAYGHKLTAEEAETGIIQVGDKQFNYRDGLTDEQSKAILDQDAGSAKRVALASLVKANMSEDDGKVQALTSLIYNVGSGSWAKSKAKKYLEAGNVEDFMHEAFSPEVGFVKINGDQSRGLVRRRAAEAQLFAQGNIDKGDSIMSQILDAINPISSAQAGTMADVIPQTGRQEAVDQALGVLGGVDVPKKPGESTVDQVGDFLSNMFSNEASASTRAPEDVETIKQVKQLPPPVVDKEPTEAEKGVWDTVTSIPAVAKAIKTYDMLVSTPASAGVADVLQQKLDFLPGQRVFTEKTMSEGGVKFLKSFAKKNIPNGLSTLTYNNTGGDGVKAVGHQAGLPDFSKPDNEIKFFLGSAKYIRVGNNVVVADEYDYNYKLELRDQNIFTKLSQIYDRYQEVEADPKLGSYAIVDSILERFQSKPGEGPSVRINLGTRESLGISEEAFNKLTTLEEYTSKATVNPRNKDWKLPS